MSTGAISSPQRRPYSVTVNLQAPNRVSTPCVPPSSHAINRAILSVQESLGRRVKLRFDTECRVPWRNHNTYKRLRQATVLLDAPNAEQAELYMEAIHEFAASLNGKWLAPKPAEPTANPSASETSK